jgi:hypothetical protein
VTFFDTSSSSDPWASVRSGKGSFTDSLNSVLDSASGLGNAPGLAMDAAYSEDPSRAAIILNQTANLNAAQEAAADEDSDGGGGKGLVHWVAGVGKKISGALNHIPGEEGVENAAGGLLGYLAKPVSEVSDDYAYLHKVWTDHGIIPGFLATLGVAGGAFAGSFIGMPTLGAEVVAAGERQLAKHGVFGDDYKQTAIEAEDAKISPGRDLASGLGQIPGLHTLENTDEGAGKLLSGGTDLAALFAFDPLSKVAGAKSAIHNGAMVDKVRSAGVAQWLTEHAPGYRFSTPESVDNLYDSGFQGGAYRRALREIGNPETNSADIVAKYPALGSLAQDQISDGQVVFKGLGSAKTPEEAHDVFRRVAADAEFNKRLTNMSVLPSKSLTRVPFSAAAERLRKIDGGSTVPGESEAGAIAGQRNLVLPQKVGQGLGPSNWDRPAILAPSDLPGAIAKKVRTFSGYMPFAIDKDTAKLSTRTFRPTDENAYQGVYRSFRFSMGDTRARYWTDRFINSKSEEEAQRIWAEGQVEMYKAAGLPDDNFLVTNMRQKLRDITDPPMTEPKSVYGVGAEKGADVSRVNLGDRTDSAALWSHQAGTYQFPDFFALKREMRDLQGAVKRFAGNTDDFLAARFTNNWFKPLALLTAGFGLRVAAAEAIPAAMRYGGMNYLKGLVNGQASKRAWRLSEGEDGHLLAATSRLWGGMQNMLRQSPEDIELGLNLVHSSDGHFVSGVGRTGDESGHAYGLPDDGREKMKAITYYTRSDLKHDPRYGSVLDKNFDTISRDNSIYDDEWLTRLQQVSQEVPAQMIAGDMLTGLASGQGSLDNIIRAEAERIRAVHADPDNAHDAYVYETKRLKRYGYVKDEGYAPEEFAENRVDALRGLLTGEDGTFHKALAEKIAAGQKPTIEELTAIDKAQKPVQVYGPLRLPYIGDSALQRITSEGFKRVIDPIINNISREPIFFNAVKQEMKSLQHFVDEGTMSYDTALRLAKTRGSVAMMPQIHNTALRSQFSQLARNFLPFYFAQEQALKRVGYLAAMHPEAIRKYELIEHSMNEPGFVQGNEETGKYLMFPLVGGLGRGAGYALSAAGVPIETGLPVFASGNMSSLKTVLPEFQAPGVSPLAAISLNTLAALFPELQSDTHAVLGDVSYRQGAIEALLPNAFMRNAFTALHPDEQSRSYGNSLLGSVAQAYYEGKMPGPDASDAEKAAFIERMKNNTRSNFMLKAVLGVLSPLAPKVQNEDPQFREEFQQLLKETGDYGTALNRFLDEHGDNAISFTVARSEPTTRGANTPYTNKTLNWVDEFSDLINGNNATGAAFLIPQDQGEGDVGLIHDEMLRMHLRERRTPDTFRDALYRAMGDRRIEQARVNHDKWTQEYANNPDMLRAENQRWSQYVQTVGLDNPVWWDDYQSQDRKHNAVRAYTDLLNIFKGPQGERVLQTEQGMAVAKLLNDYHTHLIRVAQTGSSRTKQATEAREAERNQWAQYLEEKKTADPRLRSVITSVISRLDDKLKV